MHPFEQYLQDHHIEPLTLALLAKVRYLTVWNAMKGHPISRTHAMQIQRAVTLLTGVPYTSQLVILSTQPVEQAPTVSIKKITLRKESL